jgi:hypothetical protein
MSKLIAAALLAAALAGCGYVGAPLPPALNIPVAITDLKVEQRSGRIGIRFTPSLKATDELMLRSLSAIELRAGENTETPVFDIHRWAHGARRIDVPRAAAEATTIEIPVAGWEGKDVIFAVRSIGPGGRPADWSPPVVLHIVAPPEPPVGLKAEANAGGVMLRWEPGGGTVKVYRKARTEENETLAGTSAGPEFLDAGAVFGTAYAYRAQRAIAAGDREAASEFSAPVSITPVDTFAPAAPAGLIVQAGIGGVEIAWDRNRESDLRGYQVWRADGPGPMRRMGEAVATASYSDKSVTAGARYRYAVSAIDLGGNESKPCEPAEVLYQ